MTEEKSFSSSQESLPMSQETLTRLIEMVNAPGSDGLVTEINLEDLCNNSGLINISTMEDLDMCSSAPVAEKYVPSSLPAVTNWPGNYHFTVDFSRQEILSRHVKWTYSEDLDKLYVKKDAPCPVNFATNILMEKGTFVRATALYSSPEHASRPVLRCINHYNEEMQRGLREAKHLIRCESETAVYKVEPNTGHLSVIVPYENPHAGQLFSGYVFKFACYGSCAGGPNRRPMNLVFTLEHGTQVIGRRTIDLKICACPGRDRTNDENQHAGKIVPPFKKLIVPKPTTAPKMSDMRSFNLPTKRKKSGNKENSFIIETKDENCYLYLKEMKRMYEMYKNLKQLPPEVKAFLCFVKSGSSEED